MRTIFGFLLVATLVTAAATWAGTANAEDKPLATMAALLDSLREGGLVIYLRHTTTVPTNASDKAEDLADCEEQRKLSAAGQAEAVRIGKSIKALGIPIGMVIASPYCRTKDTARLAFGRFAENRDLGFVMGADAGETRRMAESLRRMLATLPDKGTNSVIVSHSANLFEAAGIFAKPEGAAYIFRPQADGGFEVVAKILPDDWGRAARHFPVAPTSVHGVVDR